MILLPIGAFLAGPLTVAIVVVLFAVTAFTGGAVEIVPMDQLVMYGMIGAIGFGIELGVAKRIGLVGS